MGLYNSLYSKNLTLKSIAERNAYRTKMQKKYGCDWILLCTEEEEKALPKAVYNA